MNFTERLKLIMDYYGLSATALADSISIQRSSISHLLSGRNKPSLDFVMKLLDKYPEVELYWLLKGEGTFPKIVTNTNSTPTLFDTNTNDTNTVEKQLNTTNQSNTSDREEIEKIVIFYKNGTFKSYLQNKLHL